MTKVGNTVSAMALAQARVLVIDPDSEVLGFIKWALTNAKVSAVRTLGASADAMAVIGEFRPDLALIELQMDGLDGVEIIRQIRRSKGGIRANLPVVLMTKSADAEQIQAACESRLNNVIAKPFTAETLLKRVRTTLSHPNRYIEFSAPPAERKPAAAPEPEVQTQSAPKSVPPRPAVKPAEPRVAKPRDAVEVPPPKIAEPRPAAVPVEAKASEHQRPETPEENVPLVDPPQAPPPDDAPMVDDPTPAPEPDATEEVPLVEAVPEAPADEADEIEEVAAEIAAIISGHDEWLRSGGETGERASFNGADLAGRDFSGRNLASASFRDADLQDTDFDSANLHSADLRGANLSSARLSNADLGQARLRRAVLKAANLSGANLKDADFAGADCTNADFSGADVTRTNFLGANLAGADLRGEELTQTQLKKALADATTKLPGGLRLPLSEDD